MLVKEIFAAKKVPIQLIGRIGDHREFHQSGFETVAATVTADTELKEFGFYFDYVVKKCVLLKPLWEK